MNKKIVSLMVALTLPLTFLVGCKKSQEEKFVMTEDTIALDGSVEYSAKTYKDAFFSTENYSTEYLQNEFEAIVKEITSKEDQTELVELLKSYSNTQDGDFDYVKTCFEKYATTNDANTKSITLDSNGMYEISSRLYKATLNATKKYYDINDFYIYYKDQLLSSTSTTDEEEFENELRMTTIKEYTLASIYKNAYNDSFITKVIASMEEVSTEDETIKQEEEVYVENTTKPEVNEIVTDDNSENTSSDNISSDETTEDTTEEDNSINNDNDEDTNDEDTYEEYLELSESVKSQIYDAGVNSAIEFIGQNITTSSAEYCREMYDALENDNPLGENKEEGYNSFLDGFKTTLENNGIEFN